MNQRRAAGSTGVAYIRWLLRARPADYMLALSVAGGSLPVVGKHLKPLGGVTAIGVWGARHASDFLSATAKDLLTPGINEVRRRDRASTQEVSVAALRGIVSPDDLAVDVGAGNAAREQAVAPGQRRYRLRGQGISQGFAFGANPVPCAHIRCRVPSPRPYRPDHDLVDCGRCPCATTILPLTRPDYSVVARRPTSPQGDYSLTLSSFGTTRIRRVDLVTTGLSSADFTGTLGGTVKRPLTG